MKPSLRLFFLIRSLSPEEKRQFLREARTGKKGSESLYLKLFLAVDAQAEYDEAAIRNQFAGTSFGKSLAFPKSHLYDSIMRSLERRHSGELESGGYRSALTQVEILASRGLPEQALRILDKGLNRACAHGRTLAVLEFLRWKRRLVLRQQAEGFGEAIDDINREEHHWQHAFLLEQKAVRIHDELYAMFQSVRRKSRPTRQLRAGELKDELDVLFDEEKLPFAAQVAGYRALAHYHHMQSDFAAVHAAYQQEVATWEAHPVQVKADPLRFIRVFGQWLNSKAMIHDYSNLLSEIARLRARPDLDDRGQMEVFQLTSSLELFYYINAGRPRDGFALVPKIEAGLEKHHNTMLPSARLGFFYNLALMLWMGKAPGRALKWVHRIVQSESGTVRQDIKSFAPLLEKVLHYELGNTSLLNSWFRSFSYRRKKASGKAGLEAILLDLIRNLVDSPGERTKAEQFKGFLNRLEEYRSQPEISQSGIAELEMWAKGHLVEK
jgi:hypothetical protein